MKHANLAGAVLLALAGTMGSALGADASDAGPAWLSGIADQKLIAVDGSSIVLSPGDAKLAIAMVSPTGAEQKKYFVLLNDTMGTVADDAAASHVIGFFRVTDAGIESQFADGHSETLALNGAGGLSLATRAVASSAMCLSWYPAGHVFSEAERRAAVADYASRLGLSQPGAKPTHTASCPSPRAMVQSPAPAKARHMTQTASLAASPIMVRTSLVHTIDAVAPAAAAPAWSAPPSAAKPAAEAPAGRGASDCLSVESDGVNLGFRNQCGYGVQFAYCLQTAADLPASCDAGSKIGAVSANAFMPVLDGVNIKASDAEHDFRWVACSGGAGEVTPRLDRADPPTGRCIRSKSS